MTIINENTVVVFTSEELKNVLGKDNGYTYVYLGDNITLTSGINISSTKINVTIDGTYEGTTYQLTDRQSLSASDTIKVSSASILKVVVCNMKVIGNNYYGIVYVPESTAYQNTVIEYNNITYTGPQITFHPNGLTRYIDCNITIGDASLTTGNEVAECNKIEIGGKTTIYHTSKSNSSFWFRNANPSLTILPSANVEFTSVSRELVYGITNLTFLVQNNATFTATTHSGFGYGTNGTGTTTIYPNASFTLKQTTYNGGYAAWYSYGPLTLEENSSLTIINNYPSITSSNYNIFFSSANSSFTLNNPHKVILYNTTANVIATNATVPFTFNFSRINLFNTSISLEDNISLSTLPTYSWYKEKEISTIKGTFTSSATTISSHNYSESELANLPSLSNFIFPTKKIVSVGVIPVSINPLTDEDTAITAKVSPNASVMIIYLNVNAVVVADDLGNFTYSYDSPLPIGTVIKFEVKEYHTPIYYTKSIEIIYPGELVIESAPKVISFKLVPISSSPLLCPKTKFLNIVVNDSRVNSGAWYLYVTISHDLTAPDGSVLEKSLVFVDDNGNITPLSTDKTLIYTGSTNDGEDKVTTIIQEVNKGILLQINNPVVGNTEYLTNITWTIE